MSTSRVLPLLLAFLLGASILAIQPAGGLPVSAQQQGQVEAEYGRTAPFMPWVTRNEVNRFYLHSEATPTGTLGSDLTQATLDMVAPTAELSADMPLGLTHPEVVALGGPNVKTVPVGNNVGDTDIIIAELPTGASDIVANFVMSPVSSPLDTVNIFGVGARIFAGCDATSVNPTLLATDDFEGTLGLRVEYYLQRTTDGGVTWEDVGDSFAAITLNQGGDPILGTVQFPEEVQEFYGDASVGSSVLNTGVTLVPGVNRIRAELYTDPGGICWIHYDNTAFQSHLRLVTDGARMATVTLNGEGDPTTGFPSSARTDSAGRRFTVDFLHANPFGNSAAQAVTYRPEIRLKDGDGTDYYYYVENTDNNDNLPYEFNFQKIQLISAEHLAPTPTIQRSRFVFSYPADLPDGPILPEVYSKPQGWVLPGGLFRVGGRDIDFRIAPGEVLTHPINPGEATQFAYEVFNTGTEDDTVTVSIVDPGAGWSAQVMGGGLHFLKPGGRAVGLVQLTPAANAVAGNSRSVIVGASSSFSDVTDPAPLTFTANVVGPLTRGVDISSTSTTFSVRPGETKSFQTLVRNTGTARDSFVVLPTFPSNVQGWNIRATPTSVQVVAGATTPVLLTITAPADAASGMSFPLGLSAQEVGNGNVADRLDITVQVFAVESVVARILDETVNRTLRMEGSGCVGDPSDTCITDAACAPAPIGECAPPIGRSFTDTDFDRTAIFRVPITNQGDRATSYKVESFWDNSVGSVTDETPCEEPFLGPNSSDGVPDGWRFNYEQGVGDIHAVGSGVVPADGNPPRGVGTFGGFSGFYLLNGTDNPLVVPARTTRIVYFELGAFTGATDDPCPVNTVLPAPFDAPENAFDSFSTTGAMTVVVSSLADPAQRSEATMVAHAVDAGAFLGTEQYAAATHLVGVELAPNALGIKPVVPGQSVVFDVIATNKGNEFDDLKVTVSGATGWTHRLVAAKSVPTGHVCDLPTEGGATIVCPDIGVYEEVHFQVIATPSGTTRIGDRDSVTVTVISGDAPGIARTLDLVARAAGTLDFAVGALGATTRGVQPGQTVSFPLFIANDGTGDDTYGVSLIRGDVNKWKAVLSTSSGLFVPAGHEVPAFLTVTGPATGAAGETDVFRIQIESKGNQARKTIEVSPILQAASSLLVSGKEGQDILIPQRGVDKTINITSVQIAGTGASPVVFTVDTASLPRGWTVDRTTATVPANPDSSGRPTATAAFKVKAPADALGTARGILHVEALAGTLRGATDVNLNLASTFGLNFSTEEPAQFIAPGGAAIFNMTLQNLGLGEDVVAFSTSTLPDGWTVLFNPASTSLGPLETQDVTVKLTAPVTANPGDFASIIAFAASRTDTTQVSSVPLIATVGFNAMTVELLSDAIPTGSPQETVTHVFNVTNTGTLPDEISVVAGLDTLGQAANVKYSGGPERFTLDPGQSAQVTLNEAFGPNIPSGILVQTTTRFSSLLDARPAATRAAANITTQSQVLRYQFADVNGDGIREYAVDRNQDAADGYEQFQPTKTPGGSTHPLGYADLERFLREDVLASFGRDVTLPDGNTSRVVLLYGRNPQCDRPGSTTVDLVDGDCDGLADFFLDGDGDGQPDYYWDADANKASPIDFRKDVNGDQVPETFVDVDSDGRIDSVYDLTRAEFTDVLQIDVDGDGQLDYVVDRDGDGIVDQDETVLYTRTGSLLIVQKVDVDGDDRLDQVFDTNGDGNPDYFIPDGSTGAVPIVLRDVNGDGTQDWTFDGDNDGRRESYYDPVTGEAHVIDAAGHFMDAMKEYWYIGALFVVVLVLFVALVLVTRK